MLYVFGMRNLHYILFVLYFLHNELYSFLNLFVNAYCALSLIVMDSQGKSKDDFHALP